MPLPDSVVPTLSRQLISPFATRQCRSVPRIMAESSETRSSRRESRTALCSMERPWRSYCLRWENLPRRRNISALLLTILSRVRISTTLATVYPLGLDGTAYPLKRGNSARTSILETFTMTRTLRAFNTTDEFDETPRSDMYSLYSGLKRITPLVQNKLCRAMNQT